MAQLNTKPFSSSKKAHTLLVVTGRKKGLDLAEIRRMVGGSVRRLSAKACSDWITRLTGKGLPNPPGEKPKAYKGRPAPGVTRMISDDQVEQIARLAADYFSDPSRAREEADKAAKDWLRKNFKVGGPRDLGTAKRGGEVIAVLKGMLARKGRRDTGTKGSRD